MWEEINNSVPRSTTMGIVASEQLPPGADESWATWKCLNRQNWSWQSQGDTQQMGI